jgi:hypothetical protein
MQTRKELYDYLDYYEFEKQADALLQSKKDPNINDDD